MKHKPTSDIDIDHSLEDLEDTHAAQHGARLRHLPAKKPHPAGKKAPARPPVAPPLAAPPDDLAAMGAAEGAFNFSYHASRHEAAWLKSSLAGLYHQQWLDDVVGLIKGGKEATVYLCQAHASAGTDFLAAKVYRPRMFRNLKNDSEYQVGRLKLDSSGNVITNEGMLNAIRHKTAYGWQLSHTSWIEFEFQTLAALYQAGGDVPRPYARDDNAILMDYIGEPGRPAPLLSEVTLGAREARRLFDRALHTVELLLQQGRIHSDLSAYNILYWEGAIALIDFPQVIDVAANPNALRIFRRDIARLAEYFIRQGVRVDARRLADRLWTAQHHELAAPIDPLYLDGENAGDRRAWKQQHN